jgi:hypothetical protein
VAGIHKDASVQFVTAHAVSMETRNLHLCHLNGKNVTSFTLNSLHANLVRSWPLAEKTRVQSYSSQCSSCGGQTGTATGVSSIPVHSADDPHPFVIATETCDMTMYSLGWHSAGAQ